MAHNSRTQNYGFSFSINKQRDLNSNNSKWVQIPHFTFLYTQ